MPTWILPENIADVLPSEARKIEDGRRRLLDLFRGYGYELVMPPMLEYLESLMAGAGEDTRLNTFKLTDQLSGRVLGVRSDTTIQVARIDAHLLNRQTVTRLCYAGAVLHARPTGLHANREPYQIGAEIYGHKGLEADAEILQLAMASLALAGFQQVRLDLCHVGIMRAVIRMDERAIKDEAALCALLSVKDVTSLRELAVAYSATTRDALLALTRLYGDISILDEAERVLPTIPEITTGLQTLRSLAATVAGHQVSIDLADLRGYHYETGVTFSAYVPGLPNAIARGGRYDHVGEAFGRQRPATGFSMDLRELARLLPPAERKRAIRAPWTNDAAGLALIAEQRLKGQVVIQTMPGHEQDQDEFDCDQVIVSEQGQWIIKKVN